LKARQPGVASQRAAQAAAVSVQHAGLSLGVTTVKLKQFTSGWWK
jgi:hypothetical protein